MDNPMYKAIFDWSSRQGSDGTTASDVTPMSAEKKLFLDTVMKTMVIDENTRLVECTRLISWPEDAKAIRALCAASKAKEAAAAAVAAESTTALAAAAAAFTAAATTTTTTTPTTTRTTETESSATTTPTSEALIEVPQPTPEKKEKPQWLVESERELAERAPKPPHVHFPDAATQSDAELEAAMCITKTNALVELDHRVQTIDMAMNLHKLDGLVPLIAMLRSSHAVLRAHAAAALATVLQNNPKCQAWAMDADILDSLCPLLTSAAAAAAASTTTNATTSTESKDESKAASSASSSSDDKKVVANALSALSALIRDNPPALKVFLSPQKRGLTVLQSLLASASTATRSVRKTIILLRHLAKGSEAARATCSSQASLWKQLISFVGHTDIDLREYSLRLMHVLLEDCAKTSVAFSGDVKLILSLAPRYKKIKAFTDADDVARVEDEVALMEQLFATFKRRVK
jgi:hypothetical protein